jgi:CheY-like chemotaxis protein
VAVAELAPADTGLRSVGVLDDDEGQAKTVGFQLEDVGIEPVIADLGTVATLDTAIAWILESELSGVICDVQLNNLQGGMRYQGAELVARLVTEHRLPCVLTTGFGADLGMLVRPYRAQVPVLLGREETEDPVALVGGLQRCAVEISEGRGEDRRTWRVPLFIERTGETDYGTALDARVGGWAHKTPMRFPAVMLGPEPAARTAGRGLVGKVFFARVNLGAEREADLFFEDPEPELVDPEGLGLHFGEGAP